MANPIAPPADEDDDTVAPTASADDEAKPATATLFERMSGITRGAAHARIDEEPAPTIRREPLDIPRFLNRQNNQ